MNAACFFIFFWKTYIIFLAAVGQPAETNFGPGGKAGEIPTDLEQATGLERLELLSTLQGKELFDMNALNMTHIGTPKNPIVVQSHDPIRFVGCTGKEREKDKKRREGEREKIMHKFTGKKKLTLYIRFPC